MLIPARTVAPAETPITLAQAKAELRIVDANSDTEIAEMIDQAVNRFDAWEGILGRALVSQTWEFYARRFPSGRLRLPLAPVSAVTVDYYDADDVSQTLATSVYRLHEDVIGPYLVRKSGQSWPSVYDRDDAITITATCGYGAAAAVPDAIKRALLLTVVDMYENRSDTQSGPSLTEIPLGARRLVAPFRRVGFSA